MADKVFADGLRFFPKHEKAPDWVIGTLVITPNDLVAWLKANPQHMTDYQGKKQLKIQIAKGHGGGINGSVDTYKAEPKSGPGPKKEEPVDDLPF